MSLPVTYETLISSTIHQRQGEHTKVEDVHIGEALVPVTSSIHDKMVLDQVAGMVAPGNGDGTSCLQFRPVHIRKVQLICVIQCLNSVAASKDIDAIVVDAGRMSTATAGSLASCLWVCPRQGIYPFGSKMEYVNAIVFFI